LKNGPAPTAKRAVRAADALCFCAEFTHRKIDQLTIPPTLLARAEEVIE
jgi:hypothetical protein